MPCQLDQALHLLNTYCFQVLKMYINIVLDHSMQVSVRQPGDRN